MAELERLRQGGIRVNAFHYSQCFGDGTWREAIHLIRSDMALCAVLPDIYCFNGAANLSGKARQWIRALCLLLTASYCRQRLDEYSLGITSHALRDHRWQAALHVVSTGASAGLCFDSHVSFKLNAMAAASRWQAMLHCWGRGTGTYDANLALRIPAWRCAHEIFWQMSGLRLSRDIISLNTLLAGCSPWRESFVSWTYLQDLALRPDEVTLNTASTAASQAQSWRTGIDLLSRRVLKVAAAPPAALASAMTSWRGTTQLLDEVTQLLLEIDVPFATAAATSCGHRWPVALHCLAAAPTTEAEQDAVFRNAHLSSLAAATGWAHGLCLVRKSLARRQHVDDFGCCQLLQATSADRQGDRWQQALDILMLQAELGVQQSYALNTLMLSCQAAWRCVVYLASLSAVVFSAAMLSTLLTRCHSWRQGLQFWHGKSEAHASNNCNAVGSLMQRDLQWQHAQWWLEHMAGQHIERDELTISSVMTDRTWIDAVQLAMLLPRWDEVSLATLLTSLPWCKSLQALTLDRRIVPDETCYNACASSLLCSQRWAELLRLQAMGSSVVSLYAAAVACPHRQKLPEILTQMDTAALRSLSL